MDRRRGCRTGSQGQRKVVQQSRWGGWGLGERGLATRAEIKGGSSEKGGKGEKGSEW